MEQIRVNRGIEIGVNDKGESIFVDAENTLWVQKFKNLINNLNEVSKELESVDTDSMSEDEQLELVIKTMRGLMANIDELFGEGACLKVFGDIVPTPTAVLDFFEQLTPIVEKYSNNRIEKLNAKYNKSRKGGKKG